MSEFRLDEVPAWDAVLQKAHVLAAILFILVGLAALSRSRRSLIWGGVAMSLAFAGVAALQYWLPREALPLRSLTVLSEGNGERNIAHIYGVGVHTGPGFMAFGRLVSVTDVLPLRSIVHANLSLALVNVAAFFASARHVLQHAGLALIASLLFAFNISFLSVAVSELPSQLLMLLFAAGLASLAALQHCRQSLVRTAAWLLLLLVSVLAGLSRTETVLVSGPAVVIAALRALRSAEQLQADSQRLRQLLRGLSTRPWWQFAGAVALMAIVRSFLGGWLGRGLIPLDLNVASAPFFLEQLLPITVVLLLLVGSYRALRELSGFAALVASLAVTYGLYFSASHGVAFELFRYTSPLLFAIFLLASLGWLEVSSWLDKTREPREWKARLLVLLIVLTPVSSHRLRSVFKEPIRYDQQRDVQAAVGAIEANPQCAVITKIARLDRQPDSFREHYHYMAATQNGQQLGESVPSNVGLSAAIQRLAPGSNCVIFYHGLDCNRVGAECAGASAHGRPLWQETFSARPYSDVQEYGAHSGEIMLATYRIVPPE